MASAAKWVRASLFPTKIGDVPEAPKQREPAKLAQAIRREFDYIFGLQSPNLNDSLVVHPNRHTGARMPNLALLGFSCARCTGKMCAVGMIT
jgi:hypothetical protein